MTAALWGLRTPPSEACAGVVEKAQWWKKTTMKSTSGWALRNFSLPSSHFVCAPPV